jgi:hypothetical protein
MPGARSLSGLCHHCRKRPRTGGSKVSGVTVPRSSATARPSASATAIWVSSVTSAIPDPISGSSRGPAGPYIRRISSTERNSVGAPIASP